MSFPNPRLAADIRSQRYGKGMRVRLLGFATDGEAIDDNQLVAPGTLGTIIVIDGLGTVHVRWDSGATLGLTIYDDFELVNPATPE